MIKRFYAQLNDGSFIHVIADRMELKENMLFVYDGPELVALADISAVISARVGDDGGRKNDA